MNYWYKRLVWGNVCWTRERKQWGAMLTWVSESNTRVNCDVNLSFAPWQRSNPGVPYLVVPLRMALPMFVMSTWYAHSNTEESVQAGNLSTCPICILAFACIPSSSFFIISYCVLLFAPNQWWTIYSLLLVISFPHLYRYFHIDILSVFPLDKASSTWAK